MRHLPAILPLLFVAIGSNLPANAADARRPNVLLIVADDLGYGELSCQGNPQIPTPHIDAIAKQGVRFTSGYVSGPYCSPTRAGMFTGRYQQRFGHEFNPPGTARGTPVNFGLSLQETPLPERLKRTGYATGMFGKWHLGYQPEFHPQKRGFDEFVGFLGGAHSYINPKADGTNPILRATTPLDEFPYTTDAFAKEAAEFIEKNREHPWFVYLPFNAVHNPLQATSTYLDRFKAIADPKRRAFAAMLSALDAGVGTVVGKVRDLGLESDTLIIFLSDNGGPTAQTTSGNGPLRGFKTQVWEGGVRVPFMIQWTGRIQAGKVYDRPIIQLDLVPTIMTAVGAPLAKDSGVEGVDLMPFLTGKATGDPHDFLFWRFGPQRAVRSGDWKLTDMGEGSKLFNLADDLGESHDLAAREPTKLKELETAYAAWNQRNIEPKWGRPPAAAARKAAAKRQ